MTVHMDLSVISNEQRFAKEQRQRQARKFDRTARLRTRAEERRKGVAKKRQKMRTP